MQCLEIGVKEIPIGREKSNQNDVRREMEEKACEGLQNARSSKPLISSSLGRYSIARSPCVSTPEEHEGHR